MITDTVDAILMASGFSRRFGEKNKLLQPLLGQPLVQHALELAIRLPAVSQIYFVCADPALSQIAHTYPVQIIHNQNPGRGQCESVRLGVLSSRAEHYLFLPCDQPFLDLDTVERLLEQRALRRIVSPTHKGQTGSPSIFSSVYREELLNLQDGENARIIKQRYPSHLVTVEIACSLPLFDIDTPEDLALANQKRQEMTGSNLDKESLSKLCEKENS